MTILNIQPGALDRFSLKLKEDDDLSTLKSRISSKLPPPPSSAPSLSLKYHHTDVWYQLDDSDDFDVFLERVRTSRSREAHILVSGPSIPTQLPSNNPPPLYTPSIYGRGHPGTDNPVVPAYEPLIVRPPATDPAKLKVNGNAAGGNHNGGGPLWGAGGGGGDDDDKNFLAYGIMGQGARPSGEGDRRQRPVSIHVLKDQEADTKSLASTKKSIKSTKSAKSMTNSIAPTFVSHKETFKAFQESNGVRTVVGSIGRVQNVRMMLKKGYRSCYMSRAFAIQNGFIPKDAALGHYGFSGITNLGSWPIQVGSHEVDLQVLLIEDSYFPVILGRSFMEKCRVEFDPLNERVARFGETGEKIDVDLVIVKDQAGEAVPIS